MICSLKVSLLSSVTPRTGSVEPNGDRRTTDRDSVRLIKLCNLLPVTISSDLFGLKRRSFLICHPESASAHAESVAAPVGDVVSMNAFNFMSSSNWWYRIPNVEMRLPSGVVKTENSSDPRTEPCGMPKNKFTVLAWQLAMPTNCSRPTRK